MFSVRNVPSTDERLIAQLEAFLLEHPDKRVRARPRTELEKAIATGFGLVLLQGTEIRGCSLIYKFHVPPSGPTFSEIGTMRVTANGFGIQEFVAKLHIVQLVLEEFWDTIEPIFAVVEPESASEYVLTQKVALQDWAPPEVLSLLRREVGVPFSTEKRTLIALKPAALKAFQDLKMWHQTGNLFRTPKGGEKISLEVGWFNPELLDASI